MPDLEKTYPQLVEELFKKFITDLNLQDPSIFNSIIYTDETAKSLLKYMHSPDYKTDPIKGAIGILSHIASEENILKFVNEECSKHGVESFTNLADFIQVSKLKSNTRTGRSYAAQTQSSKAKIMRNKRPEDISLRGGNNHEVEEALHDTSIGNIDSLKKLVEERGEARTDPISIDTTKTMSDRLYEYHTKVTTTLESIKSIKLDNMIGFMHAVAITVLVAAAGVALYYTWFYMSPFILLYAITIWWPGALACSGNEFINIFGGEGGDFSKKIYHHKRTRKRYGGEPGIASGNTQANDNEWLLYLCRFWLMSPFIPYVSSIGLAMLPVMGYIHMCCPTSHTIIENILEEAKNALHKYVKDDTKKGIIKFNLKTIWENKSDDNKKSLNFTTLNTLDNEMSLAGNISDDKDKTYTIKIVKRDEKEYIHVKDSEVGGSDFLEVAELPSMEGSDNSTRFKQWLHSLVDESANSSESVTTVDEEDTILASTSVAAPVAAPVTSLAPALFPNLADETAKIDVNIDQVERNMNKLLKKKTPDEINTDNLKLIIERKACLLAILKRKFLDEKTDAFLPNNIKLGNIWTWCNDLGFPVGSFFYGATITVFFKDSNSIEKRIVIHVKYDNETKTITFSVKGDFLDTSIVLEDVKIKGDEPFIDMLNRNVNAQLPRKIHTTATAQRSFEIYMYTKTQNSSGGKKSSKTSKKNKKNKKIKRKSTRRVINMTYNPKIIQNQ